MSMKVPTNQVECPLLVTKATAIVAISNIITASASQFRSDYGYCDPMKDRPGVHQSLFVRKTGEQSSRPPGNARVFRTILAYYRKAVRPPRGRGGMADAADLRKA